MPRSVNPSNQSQKNLPALAIFSREPIPGKAKTRLIPSLGPRGAADFHSALVSDTLQKVNTLAERASSYFFLAGKKFPFSSSLSDYALMVQRGTDLGARLANAFRILLKRHASVLVIGTDSPQLSRRTILKALAKLRSSDAVLGPSPDGGFYLIGLRRLVPGLFVNVRWGSGFACEDMQASLKAHDFHLAMLDVIADVDRPKDVEQLKSELLKSAAARRQSPSTWRFLREFYNLSPNWKPRRKE